jgi:hypothetical protein
VSLNVLAAEFDCGDKLNESETFVSSIKIKFVELSKEYNAGIFEITNTIEDDISITVYLLEGTKPDEYLATLTNVSHYLYFENRWRKDLNHQSRGWKSNQWGMVQRTKHIKITLKPKEKKRFLAHISIAFHENKEGDKYYYKKYAYRFEFHTELNNYYFLNKTYVVLSEPFCFIK